MENNTVVISTSEHEQLVRDSEKVRILSQAALNGVDIGTYWMECILGIQHED